MAGCQLFDAPQPILILFIIGKPLAISIQKIIDIIIMDNSNAAEQPSASDINVQPPEEGGVVSRVTRVVSNAVRKMGLTPQQAFKGFLLVILVAILIWIVTVNLETALLKAKRQFKYSSSSDVQEISGLDEEGYRAFYYYKQMVQLSKANAAKNKTFDGTTSHQFDGITFNELFGLFKVVKAIQYAKNYSAIPKSKEEETQHISEKVDPQILQKAYNYTEYFPAAANQYRCGSCYSFPITATIEYLYRRHLNITVKLSEQQLIDCSAGDESVDGCAEGNITKGFQYAMKVGLVEQEQYPYRSKNGHSFPCRQEIVDNPNIKKYKIDGFTSLPKENCEAIQYQLSKGNVVASMIAAGQLSEYTEIETAPFRNCPKDPFNHAITIVGQTDKQEWIVRNSWGSSWGKNGYFIMRGNNTCGICTHSLVPFLNSTQP